MEDTFPFKTEKTPTVIVAEDSPTQALNIEELLENAGMRVVLAKNGKECMLWVEQIQPDLILLDLEMPEMNGIQTCQALKARPATASIPIIIFTRHEDPELARLSFQTGAVDYIPKDAFANAVLLETLRELGFIASAAAQGKDENQE
jgi:CheY-like chemotaxis protein